MDQHLTHTPKKRLDVYLAELYPDISRSFLQKLCNSEQVLVNGSPEKSGFKLKSTDSVKLLYDLSSIEKIDDIELPVLYEDADVLVVDKPVGVISHARGRYWNEPSVASFVRQRTRQTGERAGIVHRLDRATGGVMICAKNQKSLEYLQEQFAARSVTKTYSAIVTGILKEQAAILDLPIERNPKAPSTFRVGPNGKESQTKYQTVRSTATHTLLELTPLTGRTHQLRVHLKYLGHPIVGDTLYGGEPADRLYLHAHTLRIRLPAGETRTFTAPPSEAFGVFLRGVV